MRRIIHSMGIPISIDIPSAISKAVFDVCQARFDEIDSRFSTYKPDSELSKYRRNAIQKKDLSKEQLMVMKRCQELEKITEGYFSSKYNGSYDPTGFVKGWAVAEAAKCIEAAGYNTYLINAGGDIMARSDKREWSIGIQNPIVKDEFIATLAAQSFSVATSGIYERGEHIYDPHTKKPSVELISVTVVGFDVIMADVLATALCAMDAKKALAFISSTPHYDAILVDKDGHIFTSSN
jgi:thiamine biosynthesis lipoprotein